MKKSKFMGLTALFLLLLPASTALADGQLLYN